YFQGMALLKTGPRPEQALPCLERAAGLAASAWPLPRLRWADLLLAQGRVSDADREFHHVLASNPDNVHAQFGLAQVALARGRHGESLRYLEAVAGDPHVRKRACALRAALHERLGSAKKADEEHR